MFSQLALFANQVIAQRAPDARAAVCTPHGVFFNYEYIITFTRTATATTTITTTSTTTTTTTTAIFIITTTTVMPQHHIVALLPEHQRRWPVAVRIGSEHQARALGKACANIWTEFENCY